MTSGIAIVACLCVCVFTVLHLMYLAPMKCRSQRDMMTPLPGAAARKQVTPEPELSPTGRVNASPGANGSAEVNGSPVALETTTVQDYSYTDDGNVTAAVADSNKLIVGGEFNEDTETNLNNPNELTDIIIDPQSTTISLSTTEANNRNRIDFEMESSGFEPSDLKTYYSKNRNRLSKREDSHFDEEEDQYEEEGSGAGMLSDNHSSYDTLELSPGATDILSIGYELPIQVEVIFCVCETSSGHWKRTFRYPDLSCLEVQRVLPVLSVATCIVTAGGAVLSGVVLYILWASKDTFHEPVRPSEIRPFILPSNVRRSSSFQSKVNGIPSWNGNGTARRNGHSHYYIS